MTADPAIIFIGSSSEGRHIAHALHEALVREGFEPTVWDQGVFGASTYTLPSLLERANRMDFAIIIATPDDMAKCRGTTDSIPRDNVILEFGLFVGAIGLDRVYILGTAPEMRFPSDVAGLTFLPYAERVHDQNLVAAVGPATQEVLRRDRQLGRRLGLTGLARTASAGDPAILRSELNIIADGARQQGWRIRTNSDTTLRLDSPRGRRHTFSFFDDVRP